MGSTDAALQEMLDEHQLLKLVHRYCRAVDRGDVDTLRSLYDTGAQDAHGGFSSGSASAFVDQIAAARPYLRAMPRRRGTSAIRSPGTPPRAAPARRIPRTASSRC
ncbi:nuclear transport factor 2 family protein [Mycobacterium sp. ITM-2016-00317]|uniref:nuclear transport factor 2 family protein n=1 Tax=Mycobacterium sp. ITM-2016-00317 TaxID=2099694 RepID=UPI00287F8786|nr:nuclear transport factor 2 family protein [Mycobacterium sp. ITM-2016-00317]WNG89231.1 nuclear transport factor 2 family protein [Mycobacterium sp. ITM-2016-00317]